MQKTKPVQFPMNPTAYDILKQRAKTLGISTGQMVENMLASLELRLERAYKLAEIKPEQICEKSDRLMIEGILKKDKNNWTEQFFSDRVLAKVKLELLHDASPRYVWTPEIKLADDEQEDTKS